MDHSTMPHAYGDGAAGGRLWGHPVRNLELFAWHWLARAAAVAPERADELCRLMRRLEIATSRVAAPETTAVGWVAPVLPDPETLASLEELVAVLRALAPIVTRPAHAS